AGRDHWPRVSFALLAGGGMRTGQLIGSTNRYGEFAKDRPVTFQSVFATLYHNLGIAPDTAVPDRNGRPMYLLGNLVPLLTAISRRHVTNLRGPRPVRSAIESGFTGETARALAWARFRPDRKSSPRSTQPRKARNSRKGSRMARFDFRVAPVRCDCSEVALI